MKSKQLIFICAAVWLVLPLSRTLADSAVFELLTTFDYPGGSNTNANGINERGDVAGSYIQGSASHGFVRFIDGHFSAPITHPNDTTNSTQLSDFNDLGTGCGFYSNSIGYVGFFYSGSTFTDFQLAANSTVIEKINDHGNFCGYTTTPNASFVSIDGTVTTFTIPGFPTSGAYGLNNLDQTVGSYYVNAKASGFRRDADGTMDYPIDVPAAQQTLLSGINDRGQMVGTAYISNVFHAVFLRSPNQFALYDYPGATSTGFQAINSRGLICGTYVNSTGAHGFIVRVRFAAGD